MGTIGPPASRCFPQPRRSSSLPIRITDCKILFKDSSHGVKQEPLGELQDAVASQSSHHFLGKPFGGEQDREAFTDISDPRRRDPETTAQRQTMACNMSQDHGKQRKRVKVLRRKHAKMDANREELRTKELELAWEHNDLNIRIAEVTETQQYFMAAFEEELSNGVIARDVDSLRNIWQEVQSANATYNARLARIRQLEELLVDLKADLLKAEDEFIKAADRVEKQCALNENAHEGSHTDRMCGTELSNTAAQEPLPTAQADLSVADLLESRRIDKTMYEERLAELEWEQSEDHFARDLLIERGDDPDLPDEDFLQSYLAAREQIIRDLQEVELDIARLEMACHEQGSPTGGETTTVIQPEDHETYGDMDAAGSAPSRLSTRPNSLDAALASPMPADADVIWSPGSTAGSTSNTIEKQQVIINSWFEGLERPKSADATMEPTGLASSLDAPNSDKEGSKSSPKSVV